ncbi:hypothetical protein [Leeia sp.]|uniref:hypothetical protein n=1 Tax=Leeia sp. TaxID=2884678 RepID=UPI0035B4F476
MRLSAKIALVVLGGFVLIGWEVLLSWLLPPLGVVFFLVTIAVLEPLEGLGWPTLQGSPDGWPIPTAQGWYFAVLFWWLLWAVLLSLGLWWWRRRTPRTRMHEPGASA